MRPTAWALAFSLQSYRWQLLLSCCGVLAYLVGLLPCASSPLAQNMSHVDQAARRLSKRGSTLYAVLELKKGASPEEVKRAYRFAPSLRGTLF